MSESTSGEPAWRAGVTRASTIRVTVRAYGPLNDFLPVARRQVSFSVTLDGRTTAKDVVESTGIPHVEIDLLLVNGERSTFDRLLENDDRVAVFPRFFSIDIAGVSTALRAPQPPRFVLDVHLGRLARHLRLAGLDTLYANDAADAALAAIAAEEHRILLTRDVGLLKRRAVEHGYFVRSRNAHTQFVEILRRFDPLPLAPFTRCLHCNSLLHVVNKIAIADDLPPRVRERDDQFQRCSGCGRVYWKGTHYQRLAAALDAALRESSAGTDDPPDTDLHP